MVKGGLIFINKRDVEKTAFIAYNKKVDNPATWVSKYGSATFCQYGIELPGGGMNEKGLVVSSQALPITKYPELDERPSIERRQWLQYQLDNYATVEEVVTNLDKIQVQPSNFGSHYFIADAKGESAVIQYIDGEAKIYTGSSLPHHVLSNGEYRKCSEFVNKEAPKMDPYRNLERFVTAANAMKDKKIEIASDPIRASFELLKDISQDDLTKWSIVYDNRTLRVFYRSLGNTNIRSFDLKKLDLSRDAPVRIIEIEHDGEGDVTDKFKEFNTGVVFAVFYSSFEQSPFIKRVDSAQILHRATYGDRRTREKRISAENAVGRSDQSIELNDEKAVREVTNAWENHWNEEEVDELLSLIHEESQLMYGYNQLANKKDYSEIVGKRMKATGSMKFKNHKIKIMDDKAKVELDLKLAWGSFPTTFKLKKENKKWLVTSFKYKL